MGLKKTHCAIMLASSYKKLLAKQNGKKLYVAAIYASEAFDQVRRLALWSKMIRKNINPAIIMEIMNYYNVSQMMVMNYDEVTELSENNSRSQ